MKKSTLYGLILCILIACISCTSNDFEKFAKKAIKNPEKYKEIIDSSVYSHKYYTTVKKGYQDRDLIDINDDIRKIKYFNSETKFFWTYTLFKESSEIENCRGLDCRKISLILQSRGYELEFIWYKTSDSVLHYYGNNLKDTRGLQKALEGAIQQMIKK